MPPIGRNSDRETLQGYQIQLLQKHVRKLRLALRGALPHLVPDKRRFPEQVLDETHP